MQPKSLVFEPGVAECPDVYAKDSSAPGIGGPPEDPAPGEYQRPVRLTVNLTPRAFGALVRAEAVTRDTKTDTVNRALMVYELIEQLVRSGGGSVTWLGRDGSRRRVRVTQVAGRPKAQRPPRSGR